LVFLIITEVSSEILYFSHCHSQKSCNYVTLKLHDVNRNSAGAKLSDKKVFASVDHILA